MKLFLEWEYKLLFDNPIVYQKGYQLGAQKLMPVALAMRELGEDIKVNQIRSAMGCGPHPDTLNPASIPEGGIDRGNSFIHVENVDRETDVEIPEWYKAANPSFFPTPEE